MRLKVQAGFTIVEVILFLALTAFFIMIAFMGIRGRSSQVQFSDSIRSLESFMQKQYTDVLNGVNLSGSGNDKDKIILGRVMVFNRNSDQVEVYGLIGDRLEEADVEGEPINERWYLSNPIVENGDPSTYQPITYNMKWGVNFIAGTNNGFSAAYPATDDSTTRFAVILRDPYGPNIFVTYAQEYDGATLLINPGDEAVHFSTAANYQLTAGSGGMQTPEFVSLFLCFKSVDNQWAQINLGHHDQDFVSEALFDENMDQCNKIN